MVSTRSQVEHPREDTFQPIENHQTPVNELHISKKYFIQLSLHVQEFTRTNEVRLSQRTYSTYDRDRTTYQNVPNRANDQGRRRSHSSSHSRMTKSSVPRQQREYCVNNIDGGKKLALSSVFRRPLCPKTQEVAIPWKLLLPFMKTCDRICDPTDHISIYEFTMRLHGHSDNNSKSSFPILL